MSIPGYQSVMLPLLTLLADGKEHMLPELVRDLATHFQITEEEASQRLPSGAKTFYNRVGWATTYLHKSGLITIPRRSCLQITTDGKKLLKQNPSIITNKTLEQFDGYKQFKGIKKSLSDPTPEPKPTPDISLTPDEIIDQAWSEIRSKLAQDLLSQIKTCSPRFFEQLVVDLLVKLGYGEFTKKISLNNPTVTKQSGDGGIDGIVPQDKLGLDNVFIQAKRWDKGTVSVGEVQKFAGALDGVKASKGVFITTSGFSKDALAFPNKTTKNIILVDGEKLANLMIDHNVGVSPTRTYEIKRVDLDYFLEE